MFSSDEEEDLKDRIKRCEERITSVMNQIKYIYEQTRGKENRNLGIIYRDEKRLNMLLGLANDPSRTVYERKEFAVNQVYAALFEWAKKHKKDPAIKSRLDVIDIRNKMRAELRTELADKYKNQINSIKNEIKNINNDMQSIKEDKIIQSQVRHIARVNKEIKKTDESQKNALSTYLHELETELQDPHAVWEAKKRDKKELTEKLGGLETKLRSLGIKTKDEKYIIIDESKKSGEQYNQLKIEVLIDELKKEKATPLQNATKISDLENEITKLKNKIDLSDLNKKLAEVKAQIAQLTPEQKRSARGFFSGKEASISQYEILQEKRKNLKKKINEIKMEAKESKSGLSSSRSKSK